MMKQVLIVAADETGAIGRSDGSFMWHLSDDLKHFKALTLGHPIIMGYTTHLAVGRLLPGRQNIILSRKNNLLIEGASVVNSVGAALAEAAKYDDTVFIIGGEEVFGQFLPTADMLYLSEVHASVGGDKHFVYNHADWEEQSQTDYPANETNTFAFTIRQLRRR